MNSEDKELRAVEREINRMLNAPRPKTPKQSTPKPQTGGTAMKKSANSSDDIIRDIPAGTPEFFIDSDIVASVEINRLYEQAVKSGQDALTAATECGRLLLDAKDECLHGDWLYWLETNFRGSHRSAQRFMRLATNASCLSHLDGESVSEALATLSTPKRDKPSPKPDDSDLLVMPVRKPDKPARSSWVAQAEVVEAEVIEPLTEAESARLVVLEAVIEEGIKKLPKTLDYTTDDLESVVVDGTKNEEPKTCCWDMARNFIASLKPLKAWEERQAIADVIHICKERILELNKLKGKEKPNITKP